MDTKQAILTCAMAELERSGTEGFSLRAVGTAAGLTPMAVYRHFKDREALLTAVGAAAFAAWERRIAKIKTEDPMHWLRAVGHAYIDFALDDPARFEACFILKTRVERVYPRDFKAGRSPAVSQMMERIAAAQAAGADWEHGWAYIFAATSALAQDDNARAVEMSRLADRYLAVVGDREAFAWSSFLRCGARWAAGDDPGSFVAELSRSILDFHELGGLWGLSLGLLLAGMVMSGSVHTAAAVRVLGAAESARASMGAGIYPFVNEWLRTALERAERVLGTDEFRGEWESGSAMSIPDGVTAALALLRRPYRVAEGPG